jgi:hypothetical protein
MRAKKTQADKEMELILQMEADKWFTHEDLQQDKMGEAVRRLARLILYIGGDNVDPLEREEVRRWQELGVMDDKERVIIDDPKSSIEWILILAADMGFVKRVSAKGRHSGARRRS